MTSDTVSPLESTIEQHIDSTSRLVRHVDLALSSLIVFSLIISGLFVAILADHWLLKEGLSMTLRFGIFTALLAAVAFYLYWKVVPLFRYTINPVYTANLIEQEAPSFKNSLINWLLLRQERSERADVPKDRVSERMFDGIVRTAAVHVQAVPKGHAVDYGKLIWSGTFLAILLALFLGYIAFSPKSPFASLARIFLPFSGIDRPQAAQFRNVCPGNTTALQGETLVISAEIVRRNPSPEPVYLLFSTDDGQAVKQRIPMSKPEGKIAFETLFPPGKQGTERGFNNGVNYWITQGESRSKQYRIDVLPAASVDIVSLQYDYPEYTGLPPEIQEHGGDIRALEGTKVTATVRSTLPLQKIDLVFDDIPKNSVEMTVTNEERTEAKGTFTLKIPSPHHRFAFRATDENGNASRRSGIYRIEVVPDQPPKVQWADTASELKNLRIDLPFNKTLQLPIQAEDPDFALRYLRFKTEPNNNKQLRIPDENLLTSPATGPTEHRGQVKKTVPFSPVEKRLNIGDTVEVWGEAADTKYPEANIGSTLKLTITIIEPTNNEDDQQQNQEQSNKAEQSQKSENEPQQQPDKGKQDEPKPDETKEEKGGQEGETGGNDQQPEQNQKAKGESGQEESDPNSSKQDGEKKNNQKSDGKEGQEDQQDGAANQGSDGNKSAGEENRDSDNAASGKQKGDDPTEQKQSNGGEGEQQGANEKKEGDNSDGSTSPQGQKQEPRPPVNPETQDGDAMERIVEQMKEEGRFSGLNPEQRNDSQRERSNALDPNSPNLSHQGNDPSNPQQSNQTGEGSPNPQGNMSDRLADKPRNEQSESETDKAGESGTDSGQLGVAESGSEPSQDTEQAGNSSPEPQEASDQGQSGSSGESPLGQSADNLQEDGKGSQQTRGGTGGGTGGPETKTAVEDPNLEYAQKVTNMVLEYLADQLKEKPSEELLNRLDWTEDQLRQFYAKWKTMSEESQKPNRQEGGKDAFLEALKGLGLRPELQPSTLRKGQTVKDNQRVTETLRIDPPQAIKDRYKIYNEGIGQ